MLDYIVIGLAVAVFGFVAYKFGSMRSESNKKSKKVKGTGRTIVVDRTPVDTSKEDELKDKYGL
jgi:hypothetical protein